MLELEELVNHLHQYLSVEQFKDYAPNGLQVQGKPKIKKIISGVTASDALIDAAIEKKADAILVHHGFFWSQENPCITGIKHARLKKLLQNDISLLAYHLPLDVHPEVGNNTQLAKLLDLKIEKTIPAFSVPNLFFIGKPNKKISANDFALLVEQQLQRKPLWIPGESKFIESIAWCTGAAQRGIDLAVDIKVDAYLTGEISEHTVYVARETGIHFFSAGHYATERYGVRALGNYLQQQFSIEHEFIEIKNPI